MKTYKLFFVLLFTVSLIGCENELEIDPTDNLPGELAFNSEANIASILIGIYDEAGQAASYGGQLQMLSDLLGATDQIVWGGSFLAPRQAFTKSFLVDNGFVDGVWRNAYEVINQSNLVLENLDIVTSSDDERNRIEGEARFLRALAYFDLVRNFGAPYQAGQANTQMGVIIRTMGITEFSTPFDAARSSVDEVYDLAISDAMSAYNLLPDTNGFFADRFSAQALLARMYFQQGNYPNARDAANDVLENSGHTLTSSFAGAFNNGTDSTEDVFAFQVTDQTGTNQLNNFYASQDNGGRGGDVRIQDAYLALFDDSMNDERATFFYTSPDNGERLSSKYINQFANVSVFRIAEMHLIRAESNFIAGTTIGLDPLMEVNTLRGRSGAAALIGPLTDELIFNERQLELGFEGFLIHDIKRTQGNVGTLPYNDDSLVYPIPQSETDTNSDVMQNPGYGG